MIMDLLLVPFVASLLALIFIVYLTLDILKKKQGNDKMIEISKAIQEGAKAFLKVEYRYIAIFVLIVAALIAVVGKVKPELNLPWKTSIAFIAGAVASAIAGYIGMSIATRSNARTTYAAETGGVKGALGVAITGGAVMGLGVVGCAMLGLCIVYKVFNGDSSIINGYAMGASLVALFARSGGGIFTKGADMGADLVGKVEAGIPEDDPRNPAVIADNVGDNVGDVAGLGADLLESYVESIIASMAIAATIGLAMGSAETGNSLSYLPLLYSAIGIIASILGVVYVRTFGTGNPQKALMHGTYVAAILTILGSAAISWKMGIGFTEGGVDYSKWGPFYATLIGVLTGGIVGFVSEYYTSGQYKPVQKLAEDSQSGPAITVTSGLAIGMQSTGIPVLILGLAVILSYKVSGIYGIAMASVGMLATTGMIVSVDSYGPIADNAGGIAEMAHLDKSVRVITDNLDSVGNTTAAIGKGFAIGSAAFAAIGLVVAYMSIAKIEMANLSDPYVIAGLLIGAMLPYVFSSLLFAAVSKSAFKLIEEVRRQFKEIKGLMEGTAKADYARCVDMSTKGAIRGMLLPGGAAIAAPVIMGLTLGPKALAGMLIGSLASGLMLGIQMANSGGAMDNAKKYIEEGHFGGKGSETHKAAVVGDTVGDPLKDTVGPSINILIKLMAVISLVIAPIFVGK